MTRELPRWPSILVLAALLGAPGLAGCGAREPAIGTEEGNATEASDIEKVLVSISDHESFATRTAKVATIEYRGRERREVVTRCHQYWLWNEGRPEVLVCRDSRHEIVVDAAYAPSTRWARVRTIDGRSVAMTCRQVSYEDRDPTLYGGVGGHLCRPAANVSHAAERLFAIVDGDPAVDESPTRTQFLPTMWKKTPPESWLEDWRPRVARALPVGEYTGFGSSSAKRCKVKVTIRDDGFEVAIYSLTADGAEGRLQRSVVLSSAMTYGGFTRDELAQKVSSAARPASVLLVSGETETTSAEYHARNLRVVRFPDSPASVEAGHTAVFVDGSYCQRLEPRLPAW